ncbi:MAG: DUF1211 domain-containing protein [Xanthomonadales bacterium]|nr:DUF1211 domain-containing protein [Xanthomonadales bacterium]
MSGPGTDIFPHDRVVFFCDAVFAIAITLLAIELKLPGHDASDAAAAMEIQGTFISYFVSFMVTGVFWTSHMLTWKYITRVNGKMVWSTLLQLMFVALMPFATREYSLAFTGHFPGRSALYAATLTAISFFSLRTRLLVVKQEGLREKIGDAEVRWFIWRGLASLIVFAAMVPLAFVLPTWTIGFMFSAIFPVLAVVRRRIFRNPNP